ncbi:DNA cytosine methyltransferase [Streptomyces sp. NPDC050804]|uniref:DNA cytosine methyltransferase n=1 Tax=Streptomyces sp. NPDC050804 TaxID=3154745 RepID=UPI003414A510
MLASAYTVEHRSSGERIAQGEKSRPAMKRAILADAVTRGAVEAADEQPEPVAEDVEPKQPEDSWSPYSVGDLVTVDDVSGEWELVCHAQMTGVWQAVLVGAPETRQEFRTRDLKLEVPAAEVWHPAEERQPEGLELDAESLAEWLDSLSAAEREELAGLFPARWLYPPMVDDALRVLNLFCGCGGTCVGLRRVLDVEVDMVCVDINADAVATQRAAGCTAIQADVTTLDPTHPALRYTRGLIVTPPCIDYTQAGKGLGHLAENVEILCEAFEDARRAGGVIPLAGVPGAFTSYSSPDGRSWAQVREALDGYTGKTGGLMLEVAVWSLGLQLGGAPLEWVAVEQSSKLPEEIRREVWVDFQLAGWGMAEWTVRDAADNGSPSHRVRSLLVARRDGDSGVSLETSRELVTWASDATRRPADLEVITRGERKTSGGNAYRMGRVIPAVTGKIRSVDVGEKGGRFTIAEVAKLVTMPPTHPVQGSRTAQCQQLGDVVAPVMACALLGVALGVEWMPNLGRYLGELYPEAHGQAESADTAENSDGDSPAQGAPEISAADTEPKESVRERLRAEVDAQPKPEPGTVERLLENRCGPNWAPLCTGYAGSEGREFEANGQDDEPEAFGQGIAPVATAQRRVAWRIAAGEGAPAVAEPEREQCSVCRCRELMGTHCQGCGHELVICGEGQVFDAMEPRAAKEPVEKPRTVICGPTVYALTVPARVDERGAVARIRDLAARVNVQHQDEPEPAPADPFEDLRREVAELRRDVEEWAADVAALAVAEAERIVRAAEQELAELRRLELEQMSREAAAVRDALEWAPVVLPHRARSRVAVWTTAVSWAVFWSAAWHESLAVVRPVR